MSILEKPFMFLFDDMIVPEDDTFEKIWNIKWLGDDSFETKESIHLRARFHWIIDAGGNFHELSITGKSREWARPLRHIIRLVKVRYKIGEGKLITVGELSDRIKNTNQDWDLSLTPELKKFLTQFCGQEIFTGRLVADFFSGSDEQEED